MLLVEDEASVRALTTRLLRLLRDVRYAVRTLSMAKGFAAVIVVSIALAIAANTTVFSVANGLLWGVLPARDPGRMVMQILGQGLTLTGVGLAVGAGIRRAAFSP